MQPPRLRLSVVPAIETDYRTAARPDEVCVLVSDVDADRGLGAVLLPAALVSQLGVLGVLVGLGALTSLEIVGPGAPPVLVIDAKLLRLLKIAAKVLT